MKITTKAHYGLMAMCELSKAYGKDPVPIKAISKDHYLSDSYLEEIFSLLKKAELIQSVRGPRGGYILSKSPKDISVGEIIRALEGPIGFTECSSDTVQASCLLEGTCPSKIFWKELYSTISTFLEDKKLSDLTENTITELP